MNLFSAETCQKEPSLLAHAETCQKEPSLLAHDNEREEVYIPNQEILDEFMASTKSEEWLETFASFRKSRELLQSTLNGKEKKVAELLECNFKPV